MPSFDNLLANVLRDLDNLSSQTLVNDFSKANVPNHHINTALDWTIMQTIFLTNYDEFATASGLEERKAFHGQIAPFVAA